MLKYLTIILCDRLYRVNFPGSLKVFRDKTRKNAFLSDYRPMLHNDAQFITRDSLVLAILGGYRISLLSLVMMSYRYSSQLRRAYFCLPYMLPFVLS